MKILRLLAAFLCFTSAAHAELYDKGPIPPTVSANTVLLNPTTATAAPRAVSNPVIYATAAGVVCDGATDNSAPFATLSARAGAGSVIYFPPATSNCLTSTPLIPVSGVTVWAYPGTVTIAPTTGNVSTVLLLKTATASNVVVHGLTFDGGGADFGVASPVTQDFNGTNVIYDQVTWQNTRGIAFNMSGSVRSGVRNSTFNNVGNHWITTTTSTDRKQAIAYSASTMSGVSITGTAGQFACTCVGIAVGQFINLSGTLGGSGSITGYTNSTTYYVSATNGTSTFTLQTMAQVAIVTSAGTVTGITYALGAVPAKTGNFFTGNYFTNIGLDSISIGSATNTVIANNRCEMANSQFTLMPGAAAYQGCIYLVGTRGSVVSGNYAASSSGNCIDTFINYDISITGNYVVGCGGTGILAGGAINATIAGNVALNNSQWSSNPFPGGITISNKTRGSNNVTVVGNVSTDTQVTKTQPYGIYEYVGTGGSYTNIWIDQSNNVTGNLTSAYGGSLSVASSPNLAAQATNTVVGNATSGSAAPTALAVGTCSTSASALNWTTNTGFGCNTAVNAAQLGGAATGTSGATIPLLNGANTWSAAQAFSVDPTGPGSGAIPYVLVQSGIPFAISTSGTMGNNGALSGLATAFSVTYSGGIYLWFPTGTIKTTAGAGNAAGWYWCVMSSTTAGTCYNSTYSSGQPVLGTTTAFSTTGVGAFTQTIGVETAISVTVPASAIGVNGQLDFDALFTNNNSAGAKTVNVKYNTTVIGTYAPTTALTNRVYGSMTNSGTAGVQSDVYNSSANATGTIVHGAVDSSSSLSATITLTNASATDYVVLERYSMAIH